jgi:hypothetical protein
MHKKKKAEIGKVRKVRKKKRRGRSKEGDKLGGEKSARRNETGQGKVTVPPSHSPASLSLSLFSCPLLLGVLRVGQVFIAQMAQSTIRQQKGRDRGKERECVCERW